MKSMLQFTVAHVLVICNASACASLLQTSTCRLHTRCRIGAERNNWYRLTRAVEVLLHTGKPLGESHMALQRGWHELRYDFRPFFLTRPRLEVFRRIDGRVERMVRPGRRQPLLFPNS
jgi:tRNA A37 N6-isopentenylltransferase MiaA